MLNAWKSHLQHLFQVKTLAPRVHRSAKLGLEELPEPQARLTQRRTREVTLRLKCYLKASSENKRRFLHPLNQN